MSETNAFNLIFPFTPRPALKHLSYYTHASIAHSNHKIFLM